MLFVTADGGAIEPSVRLNATSPTSANWKKPEWPDWPSSWTVWGSSFISGSTTKNCTWQERRKRLSSLWLQPWWRFLSVIVIIVLSKTWLYPNNKCCCSVSSPWSNTYEPPLEDGTLPTDRLRRLEIDANAAFDQYRQMYFEGGVSSVYLWDLDHGFAGVILIKRAGDGARNIKGCWDSIHVIEVQEKSTGRSAHYKLTSTVMLWLQTSRPGSGTMNLGGSLTRQVILLFIFMTVWNFH